MQIVPMKGKVAKVAKVVVSSHHNLHCKISKGNLIVAKPYFYTNGYTSLDLKNAVIELFNKHNITVNVLNSGNCWKPFKGGSSVWQSSRFWVELNISSIEDANLDGLEL